MRFAATSALRKIRNPRRQPTNDSMPMKKKYTGIDRTMMSTAQRTYHEPFVGVGTIRESPYSLLPHLALECREFVVDFGFLFFSRFFGLFGSPSAFFFFRSSPFARLGRGFRFFF